MMVRDTLRGIKLEATQEPLTAQGGAVAFLEFMRAMKRGERAKDVLPAPGSNRWYGPEVYVNAFWALFALGGKSLADLRELGRERPLLSLLEQERIPNEDTAGEWLRRLGDPHTGQNGLQGLDIVRDGTNREILSRDGGTDYTFDLDASFFLSG